MPANPRQSCIHAIIEWEKGKYFSDEILHTSLEKHPLPPLDRAFFMETFFGVLRNLSRLDFQVARCEPAGEVEDVGLVLPAVVDVE